MRQQLFILFLSLSCLWFCPMSSQAVELSAYQKVMDLAGAVEYAEDPMGAIDIEQLRMHQVTMKPWTTPASRVNFGFSRSVWWLRLNLQRSTDAPSE